MRKRVLFTGAVLAVILLLGSTSAAFASSGSATAVHGWTSVAEQLHLSPADVASIKSEIASGKSIKDVLSEHGITMNEIRNAISSAALDGGHVSNTQIATIAAKLGLNATDIQNDINSGKSLQQILTEHNITNDQLHAALGSFKKNSKSKSS